MLAFFPPLPLIFHFCIYNMLIVRRLLSLIIPAEFLQKSRCGWDDLVFDLRMIVPGKKKKKKQHMPLPTAQFIEMIYDFT